MNRPHYAALIRDIAFDRQRVDKPNANGGFWEVAGTPRVRAERQT